MTRPLLLAGLLALIPCTLQAQEPGLMESIGNWNPFQSGNSAEAYSEPESKSVYIGMHFSEARLYGEPGGFNTAGGFANPTDEVSDDLGIWGVTVGTKLPLDSLTGSEGNLFGIPVGARLEAEYSDYEDTGFLTGSFPGAPPFGFIYQVQLDDVWKSTVNLWFDFNLNDIVGVYAGGGIGASHHTVNVTDLAVAGTNTDTDFAWQGGAGMLLYLTEDLTLDLGWRYVDLGEANVPLTGGAAGNYTFDLESHELFIGLKWSIY